MINGPTLSDRLNYALKISDMRKVDLARAICVRPQVIQFLCDSKTVSSRYCFDIAEALGLNHKWFIRGEGEMFVKDDPSEKLFKQFRGIPVLTIDDLIYKTTNQEIKKHEHYKWIAIDRDLEGEFFGFKMPNRSMEPLFPFESMLVVDAINDINKWSKFDYMLALGKKFNTIRFPSVDVTKIGLVVNLSFLDSKDEFHCLGKIIECRIDNKLFGHLCE